MTEKRARVGQYVTIRTSQELTMWVTDVGPNGEASGTIEGNYEFQPYEVQRDPDEVWED